MFKCHTSLCCTNTSHWPQEKYARLVETTTTSCSIIFQKISKHILEVVYIWGIDNAIMHTHTQDTSGLNISYMTDGCKADWCVSFLGTLRRFMWKACDDGAKHGHRGQGVELRVWQPRLPARQDQLTSFTHILWNI